MTLVKMSPMLRDAKVDFRGVGAFSVGNMEMIIGAVTAAEEKNTPIILQLAQIRLPSSPLYLMAPMMIQAAKKSKVDIAVHLDHGLDRITIKQALDLGFTSVMFDGSMLPLLENIQRTNQIKELVQLYDADLEAELGVIGGSEGDDEGAEIRYTDPISATLFSKQTQVDALAVAIGNAHGRYKGDPKLDFDILESLYQKIEIPLVLHGGSGLTPQDFIRSIRSGIRKINIATASFEAYVEGARKYFDQDGKINANYFDLNESLIGKVYENIKWHIDIFNHQEGH